MGVPCGMTTRAKFLSSALSSDLAMAEKQGRHEWPVLFLCFFFLCRLTKTSIVWASLGRPELLFGMLGF